MGQKIRLLLKFKKAKKNLKHNVKTYTRSNSFMIMTEVMIKMDENCFLIIHMMIFDEWRKVHGKIMDYFQCVVLVIFNIEITVRSALNYFKRSYINLN